MTTFVLHGGRTKIDSVDNNLFFKQFTDTVSKNRVKILLCYWARERGRWNELFEKDRIRILMQTNKKTDIDLIETIEALHVQLKEADVLYFSGGEEEHMGPYKLQLPFLKDALDNKVFIGSSMGAFLASKHYVLSLDSQNTDAVYSGLGLVPYNILCHWDIETNKDKKIAMLKEKDPQTPLLLIEEEKFEILKVLV
ncbi:hypothetical protein A2334_01915 [Candidatus Roizmanbacteria bacterium RIFOXYB2_FULL_38_10]|uniref:Peptidase S51 n=1 Tax=Candidatus Roizmanbacteria bacterium RIFOXYD1_FULL_38_12 TaxID=1802093 RepID=A0A1F7L1Y3_9BACT|nr:MAG: hypothetical protein A3K47_05335 [Candidatus Roizmanbacteria bacterium RIFOXYA2_FULL_38_14]OGK64169.1 MAG: hypothetical protein A3K27_05335 [Candidatus Roizmanbacteria bacterium RIFOXYA1_FULL_37_12]OGK66015.1 MAG: hypothetical protein A3K38_05335 [Candidatus Roizmanbacteria bacterium RIFOXYB1_FULL_40_23]OGK67771.1 MAG: hypothetical protein A2334_01915 [Candidatus Roizmanbacteria bacterium RIFOXYB2_FULL_38_10]OGK70420.1 MAG: hypothetical protein A3K21_05340 [Candidatus Roizmanbacteria ba